jgi:hypothetical protein
MRSRQLAAEHRRDAKRASFAEGADLIRWAGILKDLSEVVLDNIDALVESTYERATLDAAPPRS